jgi:glycosyltransferase involved in cell wall biosynthesis
VHWTIAQGGREGIGQVADDGDGNSWLVPFVPGNHHQFTIVPATPRPSFHQRSRAGSGFEDWMSIGKQATRAWNDSRGGVITTFPQLPFVIGLRRQLSFRRKPVLAWAFNFSMLYRGAKRAAAHTAFAAIDRFVVHSSAEISRYAEWLRLPAARFTFVHFQRALFPVEEDEDRLHPFVLAMGSARRDYETFFEAMRQSKLPTVVVAAPHAISGLVVPKNVEVRSALSPQECRVLAKRARVNVVPVANEETASGQTTVVEAMRMGRAVVATRCIGTADYMEEGVTGVLVKPRDVEGLRSAIERMWEDANLRARLGQNAQRFADDHCSDEAAGASLGRILDELEGETVQTRRHLA